MPMNNPLYFDQRIRTALAMADANYIDTIKQRDVEGLLRSHDELRAEIERLRELAYAPDGQEHRSLYFGEAETAERLRAALKPFAEIALLTDHAWAKAGPDIIDAPDLAITPSHVRAARKALNLEQGSRGEK